MSSIYGCDGKFQGGRVLSHFSSPRGPITAGYIYIRTQVQLGIGRYQSDLIKKSHERTRRTRSQTQAL